MSEKNIDFPDIIPNRYVISDEGHIFDTKEEKILQCRDGMVYLYTANKQSRTKPINLGKTLLTIFKGIPDFDFRSKLIWVYHRNGIAEDYHVDNLAWGLYKSHIEINVIREIYDIMLKTGITCNIEISRRVGMYISPGIIKRLLKSKNAFNIAALLGVDYNSLPNKRVKTNKNIQRLEESQVIEICKLLKETGDPKQVSKNISYASLDQIRNIAYGHNWRSISKLYFDDYREGSKTYVCEKPEDTIDEQWKLVPKHLLVAGETPIYVSSKGRFLKNNGEPLIPRVGSGSGIYIITINKHRYLCSRLVLATFGIDLPNILSFSYDGFSIRYKDLNKANLEVSNLYWAPRYVFPERSKIEVDIQTLNNLCCILKDVTNYDSSVDTRVKCHEIIKNYQLANKINTGYSYSYFTRAFETLNWKHCVGIKGNYQVSDTGIVRFNKMTMIQTHSTIDDGRNYVTINGKEYLVCKLVLKAFKPMKTYDNYFPKHIDGDLKNDHIDNLTWSYLEPESLIGKRMWAHHIKEQRMIVDWIEGVVKDRYEITNTGRVFDKEQNRFVKPYIQKTKNNSRGKKYVKLIRKDKENYQFDIAREVIRCFRPDLEKIINDNTGSIFQIEYIDQDPINCIYTNLSVKLRSLSIDTVEKICQMIVKYDGCTTAVVNHMSSEFEHTITDRHVQNIKSKRCFTDISNKYFDKDTYGHSNRLLHHINKLSLDGTIISQYNSVKECLIDNPFIERHGLLDHGKGKRKGKPYKGFIWEYVYHS